MYRSSSYLHAQQNLDHRKCSVNTKSLPPPASSVLSWLGLRYDPDLHHPCAPSSLPPPTVVSATAPGRRLFHSPAKLPTTKRFRLSLPTGSPQPILQRVQLCPAQLQAMSLGSLQPPAAAVQATARRSPSAARCPRGAARLSEVRGWASGQHRGDLVQPRPGRVGGELPRYVPGIPDPALFGLGRERYVPEKAAVADDTTTPLAHRVRQRI